MKDNTFLFVLTSLLKLSLSFLFLSMHTIDLIKTNDTKTKLRLCLVPIKFEGKCEGKKKRGKLKRKKKNRFKVNKIFLFTSSIFFFSII